MSRYRLPHLRQGLLAVGLGLAATACGDPELNTNLRPEGPPDVLVVLTQNPIDWDGNTLTEQAVKCRYVDGKRDPKAPGFVGDPITGGALICPETETEFMARDEHMRNLDPRVLDVPWGLRIMFDELLNGDSVETLVVLDDDGNERPCTAEDETCQGSLAQTQPFTLTCGATDTEVGYTGFYVPNGNNVTFPLGPSLFIRPNVEELVFPTGSACTLTLDPARIKDKDGESVPDTGLGLNIPLKIADLELITVDPDAVAFIFNATLADDGVDPAAFELKDDTGATFPAFAALDSYNVEHDAVFVFPDTDTGIFFPGDYTATMKPTTVTELNGGTLTTTTDTPTEFSVAFGRTSQTSGTDFSPSNSNVIRVAFNNAIDATSLDTANGGADYEFFTSTGTNGPTQTVATTAAVGDAPAGLDLIAGNAIVIDPAAELPLGTYVLRLKGGGAIKDVDANTAEFSAPVGLTYNVLLKVRSVSPANNGMLPIANPFKITYSGSLDPATVSDAEFEIVDLSNMMQVPFTRTTETCSVAPNTCTLPAGIGAHMNDTVVLKPNANLVAGRMYRITMKAGASLTNVPELGFKAVTRSFTTATNWTVTAI